MHRKIGICNPGANVVEERACVDASAKLTSWVQSSDFATETPVEVIDITLFDGARPSVTPARVKYFSRYRRLEVDVPITLSFFEPKDEQQALEFTLRLAAHALRYSAMRVGWDVTSLDGLKAVFSGDSKLVERFENRIREAESFVPGRSADEDAVLLVTVERKADESSSAFGKRLAALERLIQKEMERSNLGELDGSDILEEAASGQVFCVVKDCALSL